MLAGAVLYAKDLKKMAMFYSALFGDAIEEVESDFAIVKSGTTELIILQIPDHISAQIEISKPPVIRSETPLKPVISVSSIDLAISTATQGGRAALPGANQWEFRGNLVQDIVDPEGNVVQLWQPASPKHR